MRPQEEFEQLAKNIAKEIIESIKSKELRTKPK